jgi:GGDEF domain-containing protein
MVGGTTPSSNPGFLTIRARLIGLLPAAFRPGRPSPYRHTLALVDTRHMLRLTSRMVAAGCLLYAIGITALLFVRGGIATDGGRVAGLLICALFTAAAVGWWWRSWPRRRVSALFAAGVELSVPLVMALCDSPAITLLVGVWFFLIGDYLIFAHSRAATTLHSLWVTLVLVSFAGIALLSRDVDRLLVLYLLVTLLTAVVLLPMFNQVIADALRRSRRDSVELAHRDPLTGLLNRRGLDAAVGRLFSQALVRRRLVVVVLLDVDRFKAINDVHGHHRGDHVLVLLAERLQRSVRKDGLVARSGGEEFVIVDLVHRWGGPDGRALARRLPQLQRQGAGHGERRCGRPRPCGTRHARPKPSPCRSRPARRQRDVRGQARWW